VRRGSLPNVLVAASFVLASCGGGAEPDDEPSSPQSTAESPSPTPVPGEAVTFRASDGVRIEGRLFGDGRVGVVLGHQIDNDQEAWWDFAELLADEGYTALTINFRGFCPREGAGCSGDGGTGDAWRDMVAGAQELRDRGAQRVVLIGASLGGTAAVVAASDAGVEIDGLVTLSAPAECCGMMADRSALQAVRVPMLFLAGRFDGDAAVSARQLARYAGSFGELMILGSGEHGTDLVGGLATPQVERRTTNSILDFLARIAGQ
jgi:predicted alpha/beta-hydrolase family hydrolase